MYQDQEMQDPIEQSHMGLLSKPAVVVMTKSNRKIKVGGNQTNLRDKTRQWGIAT